MLPLPTSPASPLVLHGDALDRLREFPEDSFDAIVTDPPYGLADLPAKKVAEAVGNWIAGDREFVPAGGRGFMGAQWDRFVPPPALWDECFRVLKPGGHIAVFAGARTQDLMGLSIRLAGFEIRDGLAWLYGSGMPHGQDLGRVAGAEWAGWNTNLKPALEPIVLARKPLAERTVAGNLGVHGTGGLNAGACRVPHASAADLAESAGKNQHGKYGTKHGGNNIYGDFSMLGDRTDYTADEGRFPPNVLLAHASECEPTGTADIASNSHHPTQRGPGGIGSSGHSGQTGLVERRPGTETVTTWNCAPGCPVAELDTQAPGPKGVGGPSRFFPQFRYSAKAPASERPTYVDADGKTIRHLTVKPVALMRWLVRLLTPPGGVILEPFAGSGTTVEAAMLEGVRAVAVEREADYLPLIAQRIERAGGAS